MTETRFVVTGNFTDDGAVAYRRADGTWSRVLAEAGPLATEADGKAAAASAIQREQREVCDPYVIEVRVEGGTISALSARERIRAAGPTIRIRRPD